MASHSVVLAIDFGTAFSGYAYSFTSDPKNIKTNGYWASNLVSLKAPTAVLLDPDRKFKAFGYEAEEQYTDLLVNEEDDGWSLFRKFKMKLYNTQDAAKTILSDVKGVTQIPAKKIFALAIKYLSDHALERLQKHGVKHDDILVVLTVPAIWNENARTFMRLAAIEAGINAEKLVLALESEAASVWCLGVPVFGSQGVMKPGHKYMVIDLGGGTADITVHQVTRDKKLKQLHEATGGYWGGVKVDKEFINMLTSLVGPEAMQRFRRECLYDVFDMLQNFEVTKRTIQPDTTRNISVGMPAVLRNLDIEVHKKSRRDFYKTLKASEFGGKLKLKGDKLRLDAELARGMFKDCSDSLCKHIKSHPNLKEVDILLVVGGFSECQLIKNAIQDQFPDKKMVFPPDAGLAILKGAVLYGHTPGIITSRVSSFTYGISTTEPWVNGKHPLNKRVAVDGKFICKDIFKTLVQAKEDVKNGHTVTQRNLAVEEHTVYATCSLYLSTRPNPQFVTDFSCKKLGDVSVRLPVRGTDFEDRAFDRHFVFENAEVTVVTKHLKSGETLKKAFNFM